MASTSGTIQLASTITDTLAAGATRPAAVAVSLQISGASATTTYSNGTAASQVSRAYYFTGSAAATPTTIVLSTIVCTDGGVGFTHVREILIYNDSSTDGQTLTVGGGTTPFTPDLAGTSPTMTVQAGTSKRYVSKPLGTTGHAVSTNINLRIDPGASTITFRVLILGYGS